MAPEIKRISVKLPASIVPSANASLHKMELAAKASMAIDVSIKVDIERSYSLNCYVMVSVSLTFERADRRCTYFILYNLLL